MDIDRMRIAAVRTLERFGYGYSNGEWMPRINIPWIESASASCREGEGQAGDPTYGRRRFVGTPPICHRGCIDLVGVVVDPARADIASRAWPRARDARRRLRRICSM